ATEDVNGLEVWDVIPPRFRQVIVVLTRSKKHCRSVTSFTIKYSHGWRDTLEGFAPITNPAEPNKYHLPKLLVSLHQPRRFL
ncbi:unnamed protein product, partial [Allacma fusca]